MVRCVTPRSGVRVRPERSRSTIGAIPTIAWHMISCGSRDGAYVFCARTERTRRNRAFTHLLLGSLRGAICRRVQRSRRRCMVRRLIDGRQSDDESWFMWHYDLSEQTILL